MPAMKTARTALTLRTVHHFIILRPGRQEQRWHGEFRLCQRQVHQGRAKIWHRLPVPCPTVTTQRLNGKSLTIVQQLRPLI